MLAPLLLPCGEDLPVQLDGLDYCWFNCTAMVDIADQDRLEGKHATESSMPPGSWDRITRWSFHLERVVTAPAVFTVPQKRRTLMCTDVLRQAVEAHDLLGFRFDLLWSPENGGVEIHSVLRRVRPADEHRGEGAAQGDAGATEGPPGKHATEAVMSLIQCPRPPRPQALPA